MSGAVGNGVDDLCFAARALAQTHAMSEASHRYRHECMERERQRQHIGEPADWAGTALLVGYCLRRAEEQHAAGAVQADPARPDLGGLHTREQGIYESEPEGSNLIRSEPLPIDAMSVIQGEPRPRGSDLGEPEPGDPEQSRDVLIAEITAALRTGDAERISLLPAEVTLAALDQLIATELDKRQEHVREQLDDAAWSELEDYIAWWVIHGYGLRASERCRP